jgi:CO/xanthine dehydrogenase Mo-binding subunit
MNGHNEVGADAMLLSRAIGRPVRVQWMREEEHGWDPKGPPQLTEVRAGLDAAGAIVAWETEAWLPVNTPGLHNVPLYALEAAGITQPSGNFSANISGLLTPSFPLPNARATVHWLKTTPIRPSNLRAPGKLGNTFAIEGMVDEIAAHLGVDPLDFHLRYVKDPKGIETLKRVAATIGWQMRAAPVPRNGDTVARGRGLAYAVSSVGNHTAVAVELAVDRGSGAIRLDRVVLAYDCGQIINPDAVRAQCEGCVIQAISRTLYEEVTFDEARVTSLDWASYRVFGFADLPRIEIELIDYPDEKPKGAAEAPSVPVPAALGNAVFDATGVRLRRVPLTRERLRGALGSRPA